MLSNYLTYILIGISLISLILSIYTIFAKSKCEQVCPAGPPGPQGPKGDPGNSAQVQYSILQSDVDNLKSNKADNTELQTLNSDVKRKLEDYGGKISTIDGDVAVNRTRIEDLGDSLKNYYNKDESSQQLANFVNKTELADQFSQYQSLLETKALKTDLDALSSNYTTLNSALSTLDGRISGVNDKITSTSTILQGQIADSSSSLNDTLRGIIALKADQTFADAINGRFGQYYTKTNIDDTFRSYDTQLQGKVDSYVTAQFTPITSSIDSRFSDFNTQLQGKVDGAYVTSQLAPITSSIDSRFSDFNTQLQGKVDGAYVTSQLTPITSSVDSRLSDFNTQLQGKVDSAYVTTQLSPITGDILQLQNNKADKTYVDSQDSDINKTISGIQQQISGLPKSTDLDQLSGQISNKADKSELLTKANTADLATKADKTELASKANTTDLATKADKTYLDANFYTNSYIEKNFSKISDVYTKAQIVDVLNKNIPIGSIIPFSGNITPAGYLPCNGGVYNNGEYQKLFSVVGTTYGTGGGASAATTFKVPDLNGKTIVGTGTAASSSLNRKLAETGGLDKVRLEKINIPQHNHSGNLTYKTININDLTILNSSPGDVLAAQGASYLQQDDNKAYTTTGGELAITATAHENMPPYLVVNFYIKFDTIL